MSAVTQSATYDGPVGRRERWEGGLALLICCWVPILLIVDRVVYSVRADLFAFDFHNYYWPSGHDVLHGDSPFPPPTPDAVTLTDTYPAGPYPAPVAVLFAPFALLPVWLADVIFTGIVVAAVLVALHLLGVRDWRCYGAVFLWAPIGFGIQTANLTLVFVLGLAVLWRLRQRAVASAVVIGTLIALKLFLWPLVIWLLATRRYAAAACSVVVATVTTLVTWAVLGFAGFQDYPRVARIFARYYESSGYTPFAFLMKLGAPTGWARAAGLAFGIAALAAVFAAARWKRSDRASFTLAVAAALLWTPIVWLHYFALLIVPLAVLSPTFSLAWLLPAILWACPVGAAPSAWKVALPLVVFALVLLLASRHRWTGRPFRPSLAA